MSFVIRAEVSTDLLEITQLEQAVSRRLISPEEVASEAAAPTYVGFVAERDGRLIGRAKTGFMADHTPKGDLRCDVTVESSARRHGVARALWQALQPIFSERRPGHLRANGNGLDPDSTAWAERLGFEAQHRLFFQGLSLTGFDPAPWLPRLGELEQAGFRFVPFAGLHTPQAEVRLHELYHKLLADTPDYVAASHIPFALWRTWALESPGAWPEGWVIALTPDGDWAGLTFAQKTPQGAHIFMTGLEPTYRGRGLAIPMKIAAILLAKAQGITHLTTLNHAANERILIVNRAMGYQVEEDVIRLVKRCTRK